MTRPWLRWVFLLTAVVLVVVFLIAQRQTVDVSYATAPSGKNSVEGDAGELTDISLPSVAEMTDMVAKDKVVRLPGSVAYWDEQQVTRAVGDADIRILVAPPGLSQTQEDQVRDVENATIRIMGTEIVGSMYQVVSGDLAGWRAQFAAGDVTSLLLAIIANEKNEPEPEDHDALPLREPTATELDAVAADLRAGRPHFGAGATLTRQPANGATAFGDTTPLVAAFGQQPYPQPVPDFGPALAKLFPDTPIVVLYGNWISYYGPHAGEFADVAAAGFYAKYGELLSRYDFPQDNVLAAYFDHVTTVRYAGVFDRPLPYQPFDPLKVALPALPWLFVLCVAAFLALSVRSVLRGGPPRRTPARMVGLTTLAVELSALSHDPAITRAIAKLEAARAAITENLPDRHVRRLLGDAEQELDTAARKLGRADYRPATYLVSVA